MTDAKGDPIAAFELERQRSIETYRDLTDWQKTSNDWLVAAFRHKYMYNFSWLGRPIIQLPADMVAMQELIWAARPDLVIETGIAHGGSLILSASVLALLDMADAIEAGTTLDPRCPTRRVLGVDIDIREHNRRAIEAHPMATRIDMLQGSSIDASTIAAVHRRAQNFKRVMVFLDSNHTHEHVLAELEAYAPLTTVGSYCVVFDGIVEDLPADMFPDRPWTQGNNPKTAVRAYLGLLEREGRKATDGAALHFDIDRSVDDKLLVSAAPTGYLKRR